ncbi:MULTISPECIES: hypothetical protein [Pseudoalteromonas]|uniref:hypothetical protein n=1 Tax=Pseudoalteromonas TaxID=53246 RepID=UPI000784B54E|nr:MULTISPECIES: hypothetical protein [Pseudoalteromonas]MCF7519260.1 hypothetical protein [Pseudoalteromonas sp. L21]UJX26975.1 hypothetical protein L3Q70_07550 [Pseudoalteromonas sp. CF6-2]|tara:strand:- start:2763 stop:2984 length:222 start_codon:yes stop_codon:yes gene_type:complete
MLKIRITGFENLKKISMDRAFNLNTSLDLKASKLITDELLKNGVVEFDLCNANNVIGLLSDLKLANATIEFVE